MTELPLPTVAQVRRYLERHNWRAGETYDYGTEWRQSPGGLCVVMPNWADDDTRLLEHSSVINLLAGAAGHTTLDQIPLTVANMLVDDDEFWGCQRDECWPRNKPESEWAHTFNLGHCLKAHEGEPRPATIDIPRTWIADDGYPAAGWTPVPLTLFAPWVEYLPPADQLEMLAEIADAAEYDRLRMVAEWRRTAEQLADPLRREVLFGDNGPADFMEAPRSGGDGDA